MKKEKVYLIFVKYLMAFVFLSASIYRIIHFKSSINEFQYAGKIGVVLLIFTITLELFLSYSLLFGRYEGISLMIFIIFLGSAIIFQVVDNFSYVIKHFPEMFVFDHHLHNLSFHFLLLIFLIYLKIKIK